MRRLLLSTTLVLLAFPASTLAALSSPQDVLNMMNHDGTPRVFSLKAYRPDMNATVHLTGMQGGRREYYKMKADLTMEVIHGAKTEVLDARVMAFEGKLYVMVRKWGVWKDDMWDDLRHADQHQWGWMQMPADMKESPIAALDALRALNLDALMMSDAWVSTAMRAGSMHLDHTKFVGGNAYSLGLGENHFRVNTGDDGLFRFARFYLKNGVIIEGTLQPYGKNVILDIPVNPVPAHDVLWPLAGWWGTTKEPAYIAEDTYDMDMMDEEYEDEMMWEEEDEWEWHDTSHQTYTGTSPRRLFSNDGVLPLDVVISDYGVNTELEEYESGLFSYNLEKLRKAREYLTSPVIHRNSSTKRIEGLHNNRFLRYNTEESLTDLRYEYLPDADMDALQLYRQRSKHNALTQEFAYNASRKEVHKLKVMMSPMILEDMTASIVEDWLKDDVVPFFVPMDTSRTSILNSTLIAVDEQTEDTGVLVHKSFATKSGKWKEYTVFIVDESGKPYIRDFYPNMSPMDLGIRRHGDVLWHHTDMEMYRHWLDSLDIEFDNRDWSISNEVQNVFGYRVDFTLPGQNFDSWEELVTIMESYFHGGSAQMVASDFLADLLFDCPNLEWNLLKDEEDDVILEWYGECAEYPERHQLRRFFMGSNGFFYELAYTGRTYRLDTGIRTVWLDLLEDAHITEWSESLQ